MLLWRHEVESKSSSMAKHPLALTPGEAKDDEEGLDVS